VSHRNKDPRVLLLLFSFLPFVIWVSGALLIWRFWNQPWGPTSGIAVILFGFAVVRVQDRIIAWIYRMHLRGALAEASPGEWIPVEMEVTGTQDKFHVLPHTVGILQRTADGLVLRELQGRVVPLPRDQILTTNVSKTNMTCSILVTDRDNNDLIGFVITPRCVGAAMEVAAYGNSRYQWFLQWAGLPRPTFSTKGVNIDVRAKERGQ